MSRLTLIIFVLLFIMVGYIAYITQMNLAEIKGNKEIIQVVNFKADAMAQKVAMLESQIIELKQAQTKILTQAQSQSAIHASCVEVPRLGSTYQVKRGENLWKISKKMYNTPWQWHRMWKANETRLGDYHRIPAGFILQMPS